MINFKKNVLSISLILGLIIVDSTHSLDADAVIRDCTTSLELSGIFYNTKIASACYASVKYIYRFASKNTSTIDNINNSNCAIRRYIDYLRTYKNLNVWILGPKLWCQEVEKRCMEPLRLLRFESDVYPSPQIKLRSKRDYETYKKNNRVIIDEETFLRRLIKLDNIDAAKSAKIDEIEEDVRENIKDFIIYAKNFNVNDIDYLESIDSYCITRCVGQLKAVGYSNLSLTNGKENKVINDGNFKGCAQVFADAKKEKGCLKFKEKKLEEWCINKCI